MTVPLLKTLSGQTIKPYPIWMMRQAGRHLPEYMQVRETTSSFIEFCLTPDKAAQVTLQPVDRYDMDAAILFADILLIPLALGRDVRFVKGKGPQLDPITPEDILRIKTDMSRIENVYETVSKVKAGLAQDKALIGFCGGPWTVATYLIEGGGSATKEKAKRFAYRHPDAMAELLDHLVDSSITYMAGQAKAGADALKLFESWAEGLSPYQFETLVLEPTRRIVTGLRDKGIDVPIIGFPRGAGWHAQRYAHETGITALAAGTDTPLPRLRQSVPAGMPLQGNLDPLALRMGGDILRDAVQRVLDDIDGPHIFNLGHGVTPDVKIDNVHAVISHVRTGDGQYV